MSYDILLKLDYCGWTRNFIWNWTLAFVGLISGEIKQIGHFSSSSSDLAI